MDNNSNKREDSSFIKGDANVISGLNYAVDSHDASNFNNTTNSNNISNSNNITTNNIIQQSEGQRLAEAKKQYLDFCKLKIKGGLISAQTRRELDDYGIELSLPKGDMQAIEQNVKNTFASKDMLSSLDQTTLDWALRKVQSNAPNLKDVLHKMEALAKNVEQDEVQYWYYLLLAIESPDVCIKRYDERTCDNYWQNYWTFMACVRIGDSSRSGTILQELKNWTYSEDNLKLLQCADLLYSYMKGKGTEDDKEVACSLLDDCFKIHDLLEDFYDLLEYLAKSHSREIALTDSPIRNFYLRLFSNRLFANKSQIKTTAQSAGVAQKVGQPNYQNANFGNVNKPNPPIAGFSNDNKPKISKDTVSFVDDVVHNGEDPNMTFTQKLMKMIKKHKKLSFALLVLVLFFIWNNINVTQSGDADSPKSKVEEAVVEKTPEKQKDSKANSNATTTQTAPKTSTSGTNKRTTATSTGNTNKATTATSTSGTKTTTSTTKVQQSSAQTNAVAQSAPVELTAEEYLRKGISAARGFNDAKALEYYKQAAAKGSNQAYLQIGHLYYNGGNSIEKDNKVAFGYYMKAAVAGITEAEYMVGKMYRNGEGVAKNLTTAKSWLRKAAAKGNSQAEKLLDSL